MKSMFRTQDVLLIALMVATAGGTYKVKHEAQVRLNQISKLQRDIRFEEDSMELLKADWSLLTQPARLQKLAETYGNELALQPLNARQIVGLADIPMKPPAPPDGVAQPAGKNEATDPVRTGGIKR
jgi:hypothetical protein